MKASPVRILYLTPGCFDKGGISRYSRYQIEALRELFGDEAVTVLSLLGPDADSFETPFSVAWSADGGGLSHKVRFAMRAIGAALAERPTHIHIAHVHFAPLAWTLARLTGARTILNIYGLEIWSGLSLVRRLGMKAMTTVIADCHYTADYAAQAGLTRTRPEVIWDCVDLDRFNPGQCSPAVLDRYGVPDKASHFVVMTLGRISARAWHKGYERLLEAFSKIAPDCPKARLVFAGTGDAVEILKAKAQTLGVDGQVVFTGSVLEDDLPDVYRAASLFSLVSDRGHGRGEGIPLTPLEAGACGAPIMVGDQDGSQEAVVDGSNGFVCPSLDVDHQARLLRAMYDDPAALSVLAAAAPKVARERFGYRRFVDEHGQVYAQPSLGAPRRKGSAS